MPCQPVWASGHVVVTFNCTAQLKARSGNAADVYELWLLAWLALFCGMSAKPPLAAFSMLRALILPKSVLGLDLSGC